MIDAEQVLSTNRAGWNHVAPKFYGGTALPGYGPLAPTEDTLRRLDDVPDLARWNLDGHSLRYLAERSAGALGPGERSSCDVYERIMETRNDLTR